LYCNLFFPFSFTPGFFNGDPNETDLLFELCEATFTTYPNNELPDQAKANFIKIRITGSAINWYISKYKNNFFFF